MSPAFDDPIPTLEDVLAEAAGRPATREGDVARVATLTCDRHGLPAGSLVERLTLLAFRGPRRARAHLPSISRGELLDLCVFACDCHGIPADDDLSWRLGVLAGRAP